MRIYTSYFANIPNLEKADIVPIGICAKVPKFFENPNLASVAPSDSILWEYKKSEQTEADWEHYKERYYNEILIAVSYNPQLLIDRIEYITDGKDCALVCYETPEDRCHRHLLADFLNEKIPSLNIVEYPIYGTSKKKKDDDIPISNELF